MNPDIEKLISLNLRYSYRERSLNLIVFADLSIKALFQLTVDLPRNVRSKPIFLSEITKEVARLLGLEKIEQEHINNALRLLHDENKVKGSEVKGWIIQSNTRNDIVLQLQKEASGLRTILERYFPADIPLKTLKKWFYDTSAVLFSQHGDSLAANISLGSHIKELANVKLDKIIQQTSAKYQLNDKRAGLLQGYIEFLSSEIPEDYKLIMDLAIRWFSARLIAANIGADPITLEEIRNSKFVLDTNVLIAIKLKRRPYAKSLSALGKALKELKSELVFIRPTNEEYENVITYQERIVLEELTEYGFNKLKKVEPDNDFLKASISLGCKDTDDFRKFFQEIRELPKSIDSGPSISLDEDDKIAEKITAAEHDSKLISIINSKKHAIGKDPGDRSIRHDASLVRVAEFLAEDEKRNVWVLTTDYALKETGIAISGKAMPVVMGLDTLIELLALNSLGLKFNSLDFAPLLASILRNNCLPLDRNQIKLSDLKRLRSSIAEAPSMTPESIKGMGRLVAKYRIEGKSIDSPEFQGSITKFFNREFEEYDEKLKSTQRAKDRALEAVRKAESETALERNTKDKAIIIAIADRTQLVKRRILKKFAWKVAQRLIATVIFVVAIRGAGSLLPKNISGIEILGYIVTIGGLLYWLTDPCRKLVEDYRTAAIVAKNEVLKDL